VDTRFILNNELLKNLNTAGSRRYRWRTSSETYS